MGGVPRFLLRRGGYARRIGGKLQRLVVGLVGAGALAVPAAAGAATFPPNFSEALVAGTMTNPTAMAIAPDGRILVTQQGGAVRVIKNGSLLATPFATLTVDFPAGSERGLLGITFDPSYATNRFVYVYYTTPGPPIHNRVSRLVADLGNQDVSDGTVTPILDLEALSATNHNGGAIHFSPVDGKLYVAVGENANASNAQVCTNRLGKILRINADGSIPSNTFPAGCAPTGANQSIWAMGLRNPFTFAFQPGTGRMFVNDVGSSGADPREEINDGIAGSNYGWPVHEGVANDPNYRDPLFDYAHGATSTTGCAIVGAAFYNPTTITFPGDYVGDYFFADLCSGWIRRYDVGSDTATGFATGTSTPVDLAVANDGSLLYLQRGGGGQLYRVTHNGPTSVVAGSFRASRTAQGVLLRWRAGDPRVLGFNVYRGGRRLNARLVTGTRFLDRLATRGPARYRLQAVLGDGSRVWAAAATAP